MNKKSKNRFIAVIAAVITMGVAGGSALAGGFLDIQFHQVTFPNPTTIANPY